MKDREQVKGWQRRGVRTAKASPPEKASRQVILQGPRAIEGMWETRPLVWLYLEMGPLRQLSRLHEVVGWDPGPGVGGGL